MSLEKINSLAPFIDLGLHTVPLTGGRIYRDEKSKKHGYGFPNDWQSQCSKKLNGLSVPIGGLMPIELIAIDCDDKKTYDLFRDLDRDNTAFMDSIGKLDREGKPLECGTILYKKDDTSPPSFRTTNGYDLDYYSGTGMVFLPTLGNETKTTWLQCSDSGKIYNHLEQEIEFKPMPSTVKNLLGLLNHQVEKPKEVSATKVAHKNRGFLAKAFEQIDFTSEDYIPLVTKILTPYEYRSPLYNKQQHLHPNDIVGSGHMYLFKIACILASDSTVDKGLFKEIIDYINDLWEDPYDTKKLVTTIMSPILSGTATNSTTGEPYWSYDENWEQVQGYSIVTKRDSTVLDVFYDDVKRIYYTYSMVNGRIEPTSEMHKLNKHLKAISRTKIKQQELDEDMEVIRTDTQPTRDFGYYEDDTRFNLFKASESLKILHNPSSYEQHYKRPNEFIDYMEHFIPEEEQRVFLLRFLKTKLLTFKYSPIVPYIIGVQGSGKNLLLTILKAFMGSSYVLSDVSGTQFLEKYNDWLCDRYFVQLNELSESLTDRKSREQAQGMLKNYTGSQDFEVRAMNSNYFTYPQTATFILTANSNPMSIEDTDRRLLYINTPNTFDHSPQCNASDPVSVYKAIIGQTNDIAYYLATEIRSLSDRDYIRSPKIEGREKMIFDSMNYSTRIVWALEKGAFGLLEDFLLRADLIFMGDDRLWVDNLARAYEEQSSKEDGEKVMKLVMKAHGFKLEFTNNRGYYKVEGLASFAPMAVEEDTEAEEIRT